MEVIFRLEDRAEFNLLRGILISVVIGAKISDCSWFGLEAID